jgi:AcrR family transcriptional regulator
MPRQVKSPSRRYRSVLRTEQAQDTRRRVLEAATRLFLERGYGGTTINAVAAEAGVSPETIYVSLGSKTGLLEGVIDATITVSVAPLLDPESSQWVEIRGLSTARERLRAWGAFVADVLAHTSPIHAIIRGAADSEPFAVALRERLLQERLGHITTWMRQYFSESLRPGLSIEEAGQRACALASPEFRHLVTVELDWTHEQHRTWLCDLLDADLLGLSESNPPRSGRRSSGTIERKGR